MIRRFIVAIPTNCLGYRRYFYGLIINESREVRLLRRGGGKLSYGSPIVIASKHRFAPFQVAEWSESRSS